MEIQLDDSVTILGIVFGFIALVIAAAERHMKNKRPWGENHK